MYTWACNFAWNVKVWKNRPPIGVKVFNEFRNYARQFLHRLQRWRSEIFEFKKQLWLFSVLIRVVALESLRSARWDQWLRNILCRYNRRWRQCCLMLLERASPWAPLRSFRSDSVVSGMLIAEYEPCGIEMHRDCNQDVVESGCDFFCGLCSDTVLRVSIDRVIRCESRPLKVITL